MSQYPPVICFACGNYINPYFNLFRFLRAKKLIENTDSYIYENTDKDIMDIFEVLGIDNDCCKVFFNTTVLPEDLESK